MWCVESALLPLDCCWWLGGDIIDDAVDATHFVDDLVAGLGKEFVWKMYPVGCHPVGGDDGAEGNTAFISAFITHHAYTLHG